MEDYYFYYKGVNLATPTSGEQIWLFKDHYSCQLVSQYSSGKWRSQDTFNFPHANSDFIAYDFAGVSTSIGIRSTYNGSNLRQFQSQNYPELCNVPAESGIYTGFYFFFGIGIFLSVFMFFTNYFKKRL